MSLSKFRWEIPDMSDINGHINGNIKAHLFDTETGKSICNKYWQRPLFYDEVEYTGNDDCYCKKCLKKYQKLEESLLELTLSRRD